MTIHYAKSTNGFYNSEIHGTKIPPDAVEITAAEHQALFDGQDTGKIITAGLDGRPILSDPPPLPLEVVKDRALTRIDAAAEAERVKYLTPGSGQAMVYQQKQAEAHAWQTNPSGTYPHLSAEIGITGATLAEVAQTVLAMEAGWTHVSAAIEGTRLAAKAVVRLCKTPEEVEQTVAGITWPQI